MGTDGAALVELIQKEQVTFSFGVPPIWLGLLNYCTEQKIIDSVKQTVLCLAKVFSRLIYLASGRRNVVHVGV